MPISYVTIGAIVVLFLSLIIGYKKGLFKSLFSLISVAGAIVCSIYLAPMVLPYITNISFINSNQVVLNLAPMISSVAVFLGALIVFSIIFAIINKALDSLEIVKALNKTMGALFYAVFGFCIVLVVCYVMNIANVTIVIKNANTDAFGTFLMQNNLIQQVLEKLGETNPQIQSFIDAFKSLINPPASAFIANLFFI